MEKSPNATVISQNHRHSFRDNNIAEKIVKSSTHNSAAMPQYFCDSKTCSQCLRRTECFGKSMKRRVVERHVWQDALDEVTLFTKTPAGRSIYNRRKETIERSFAEAKVNHGLRFARMLGIRNMREQCFLTAAVQNIKRMVASFLFAISYFFDTTPTY